MLINCGPLAGRKSRENQRIFRVPEASHAASCGVAKEDERNLYGEEWGHISTHSDPAAFYGFSARYAQCSKRHSVFANQVCQAGEASHKETMQCFSSEEIETFKTEMEKRQQPEAPEDEKQLKLEEGSVDEGQ